MTNAPGGGFLLAALDYATIYENSLIKAQSKKL
jgi:hypothetical protein